MKSIRNLLILFALFLAILVPVYAVNIPSDISGDDHKTAIEFLYEQGVVSGYSDGTFRPTYDLNRAELLKFVAGTKGKDLDVSKYKNCFPDVKEDWYAKYVCYAKSEGWISGYSDGFFKPANKVNKAEAIKIAVNAFGIDLISNVGIPYSDIEEQAWYFFYLTAAYQNNLLEEDGGKYNPGANMSRGQISEVIYRILRAKVIIEDDDEDSDDDDLDVVSPGETVGNRGLLSGDDFTYLGAFRLPEDIPGHKSRFAYGGYAMALNPDGDPSGPDDDFPGSLYISGHDYLEYVAEVSIPVPKDQRPIGVLNLNTAAFLQPFEEITEGMLDSTDGGNGTRLDGLAYLGPQGNQTSGKLYWTVRTYYNVDGSSDLSHGASDLDFTNPNAKGLWRLSNFHSSMTSGYIFPVPVYFADVYLGGKRLISGLFTQQGVSASSQGPAFFAYAPWQDAVDGILPGAGAVLDAIALTYYPYDNSNYVQGDASSTEKMSNFPDFQIPDGWEAAAWVNTDDAHAVVVVGTRAMSPTYYGPPRPGDCNTYTGYYGTPYEPRLAFYNPADLAKAAQGQIEPWDVLPYSEWNPEEYMVEHCEWSLMGAVYDEENHLFYALDRNADREDDEPKPLIYVFRVGE
ncbi:S-layer homology domain-containing protein [Candidatus Peregrinibacteria bacterium]|nr:S-layer homology domain-containing protein [Candidatus Peregrinibacteria bacterium]